MSKIRKRLLTILVSLLTFSTIIYGQATDYFIDLSRINTGVISIEATSDRLMALRVIKEDKYYDYILRGNNTFPLQFGDGEYSVYLLENVEGNSYKVLQKETFVLALENSNEVYLQSIQMIHWNEEMEAIKLAKDITQYAENDLEKVTLIYNYVVSHIAYDFDKVDQIDSMYLPNIETILLDGKGICYDYTSLFAAMLRSVGVPTKLMMGTRSDMDVYHAWNQVYLEDSDQWVTIDTTYDAGRQDASMIKDNALYTIEKEY